MINTEAKLANSLMQYEHHAESSHHGSVTRRSFLQRDKEECHDRMMKNYFIKHLRFPAHHFRMRFRMRIELFESVLNAVVSNDHYFARKIDVVGRQSRHNKPTIVLEDVASYDIWIWHAFFSVPGSNNDINSSPLFDDVVNGWAPEFQYKINGNRYELGYYITYDKYIEIEEDSDKAIVRDVEYLTKTTYETLQDRVT
ncbi:unnamed protein product [Malus baccata var. baccata]